LFCAVQARCHPPSVSQAEPAGALMLMFQSKSLPGGYRYLTVWVRATSVALICTTCRSASELGLRQQPGPGLACCCALASWMVQRSWDTCTSAKQGRRHGTAHLAAAFGMVTPTVQTPAVPVLKVNASSRTGWPASSGMGQLRWLANWSMLSGSVQVATLASCRATRPPVTA
jgi:hypothetical protein